MPKKITIFFLKFIILLCCLTKINLQEEIFKQILFKAANGEAKLFGVEDQACQHIYKLK